LKEAFQTSSLDKSAFKKLLHEHTDIFDVVNKSTFNFSHATQQELFSAYHISHLPDEEQIEFLRNSMSQPKFSMVLRFYAGLTRLLNKNVVDTILHEPGFFDIPFLQSDSTTDSVISRRKLDCDNANPGLLHLLHFLYESQNTELTQSVARHLDGKWIDFNLFLTSYDTRVIAYCLSKSHGFNRLEFWPQTVLDSDDVLSCVSSILMSESVTRIQHLSLRCMNLSQTSEF